MPSCGMIRGIHTSCCPRFRHTLGEISRASTSAGERDRKLDQVTTLFNECTNVTPQRSITETLNTLISSLFVKYDTVINNQTNRHLSTFEADPQQSNIQTLKSYLIKNGLNKNYQEIRRKRRDQQPVKEDKIPLDHGMLTFLKHLENTRMLTRDPNGYYRRLASLYLSLQNYSPPVAYMQSHSFELLLKRMMFGTKNLWSADACIQPLAAKLLADYSQIGTQLTRNELFRLLQLANNGGDMSRLRQLYEHFLHSTHVQHDNNFFNSFLNASMHSKRFDVEFAQSILKDMVSADIGADRMTDYLLLRLGTRTHDKSLILEAMEHLLSNLHLDIQSVQLIIESLLSVDEYVFARAVLAKYLDALQNDTSSAVTCQGNKRQYELHVRLIDYIVLKEYQNVPTGFLYRHELHHGIITSFTRYFDTAPRNTYLTKERSGLREKIEAMGAYSRTEARETGTREEQPAADSRLVWSR